jgi:quinol monooxygenase YgiN
MSGNIKKFCLNVTLWVKPERREEFLSVIRQNQQGTLANEPLVRLYAWGENTKEPNTFHFQEQYIGEEGFIAHTQSEHFAAWKKFADEGESPFTQPPLVEFFEEPDLEYSTAITGAHPAENEDKKFGLNVTVFVKPERREDFLKVMKINHQGTLTTEAGVRIYTWGENTKEPNTFHVMEQYLGEAGFHAHTQSEHFAAFSKFAEESPFVKPSVFSFFQEM